MIKATVQSIDALSYQVKGLRLKLPADAAFSFDPGQYLQLLIPIESGIKPAYFSIASAPQNKDHIDLCIKAAQGHWVGDYIHALKVGDSVNIEGPGGKTVLPKNFEGELILIGTGTGIAPLRSMAIEVLNRSKNRVVLVFGNRAESDILYRQEWADLQKKYPHFETRFVLSQGSEGWKGNRGYVQDNLEELVKDPAKAEYFICGSRPMVDAAVRKIDSWGVPHDRIHFEKYG